MLIFAGSQYAALVLQFVRGILVAGILGPELFGIWGFITLVQQYLTYSGLGLQHSVTVELAAPQDGVRRETRVLSAALGGTVFIGVVLVICAAALLALHVPLFPKYRFSDFVLPVAVLASLTHVQQVLRNISRVFGAINRVAATDLMSAGAPLVAVALVRGDALLFGLLYSLITAAAVSVAILLAKPPFKLAAELPLDELLGLLKIGLPLLVYTISFYLITIVARTVISAFYTLEVMGYYSFATAVTMATLLGLKAVTWVVFPSILSGTGGDIPDPLVRRRVDRVNTLYGTAAWLLVFVVLMCVPLLLRLLPDYTPMGNTLVILLLSQAVLAASFGYNSVAIARRQQMDVARLSIVAVGVVAGSSLTAALAGLHYVWIAVSVFLGTLTFTFLQSRLGERLMPNAPNRGWTFIRTVLPPSKGIPLIIVLAGILLTGKPTFWTATGFVMFVILARGDVRELFKFAFSRGSTTLDAADVRAR